MHKRELVASMVTAAKSSLKELGYGGQKTVSVKIRVHKDLRETVDFLKTVEQAGVDFVTIHGRLRSTPSSKPVDLEAIKTVAGCARVPTISNGDVFSLEDVKKHVEITGVNGVMAARGILENPALFEGRGCSWEVVECFLNKVVRAPIPFKLVVHHLSEMVGTDHLGGTVGGGPGTLLTKEERMGMMECASMAELIDFLDEIREIRMFP
jgi:tRNA-dihydrouridine synthase 4